MISDYFMSNIEDIKTGQKVEVKFKISSADEIKLVCSVKDIHADRLDINFPKGTLNFTDYLQEGYNVNVDIYTPHGIKKFNSVIIDSPETGSFMVEFGGEYDELQRRKYVRAQVETKLILRRVNRDPIISRTIEISGDSVRFYYEGHLQNKEPFDCFLYLPKNVHSIKAKGIIVKTEHIEKNEHLILFTQIQDFDRVRINRKCIELNSGEALLQ